MEATAVGVGVVLACTAVEELDVELDLGSATVIIGLVVSEVLDLFIACHVLAVEKDLGHSR